MALKNAFGDLALEETLQQLTLILGGLAHTLGYLSTDTSGRLRINLETGGTLGAVSTVSNQSSSGGYLMSYDQYGQMMQSINMLRNNIQVS